MREGGLHVTVVGHEAGVAGLPAVKALMALEHQLPTDGQGKSKTLEHFANIIYHMSRLFYLDRLGEFSDGARDGIPHSTVTLDVEFMAQIVVRLKLSSLAIRPRGARQECVAQRPDMEVRVSANHSGRIYRPLNVLLQTDWLLKGEGAYI